MKQHWMITVRNDHSGDVDTLATDEHPADWLTKYGVRRGCDGTLLHKLHILFAMQISEEQDVNLTNAGYQ